MASIDKLRKLKLTDLRVLAIEKGIDANGNKKQELIEDLLNSQVPTSVLTPVHNQSTPVINPTPTKSATNVNDKDNLPPFHRVKYLPQLPYVKVLFTMIYDFLITRATESGGSANNFKGLDKAVKHHDAGDVKNISHAKVNDTTMYVRALCQASMKKMNYQVFICFSKENEEQHSIDYAYCQCPIGAAQACSHIGALLFALKDPTICNRYIYPLYLECSSRRSQTPSFNRGNEDSNFDPRHSLDRQNDMEKTLTALQGMSHLWNIPDPVPDMCMEEEVETSINPLYQQMMKMLYTEGNLPPSNIDMELVKYIEEYTQSQRLSKEWFKMHIGRVTSSLFGDVMSSGPSPTSLIKQIVEGSNLEKYTNLPAAVQWGIDKEGQAREQYKKIKKAIHKVFEIQPTGLDTRQVH
ncbi:hypothetical protein LOTGIDRAFT_229455 [Lottia gigantea]|uniref:SWIM-type domain-containing protein n=1 Tax=Lottia gigantea TaxID=225164 RepID=V3ZX45_LOTGI|nr:hypothetical protein LOTGIDRAFT_229455 [Lottia gigantea]ESO85526.1 hypothetical protein LOTGIDRAFT_229455 [Lottia gigantea]